MSTFILQLHHVEVQFTIIGEICFHVKGPDVVKIMGFISFFKLYVLKGMLKMYQENGGGGGHTSRPYMHQNVTKI